MWSWLDEHPRGSRKSLARELCARWEWVDGRGRVKDFAARSLLLKLEAQGHLRPPPLQVHQRCAPQQAPTGATAPDTRRLGARPASRVEKGGELLPQSSRSSALPSHRTSRSSARERGRRVAGQTVAAAPAGVRPILESLRTHASAPPLRPSQKPRRPFPLELITTDNLRMHRPAPELRFLT